MSIWRNERYRNFEHLAERGDRLRGEPGQPFPWTLRTARVVDAQGDEWVFEVLCNGVESTKVGMQMEASFTARARCNLREERVAALGFDLERLDWLGMDATSIIEERLDSRAKLKMEQLEQYASLTLERMKNQILTAMSNQEKHRRIKEAIDNRPLSRFSLAKGETLEEFSR
jgi:hypothetical protein